MSKKENLNNVNGASLGEISTIRDILMGQHINDFESQFKKIQEKMDVMEAKLNQKIKDLSSDAKAQRKDMSKETSSQLAQLEDNTNNRLSQLEQSLSDGLANLQAALEESSMNDKERIGQLLMEAGKSLMKS